MLKIRKYNITELKTFDQLKAELPKTFSYIDSDTSLLSSIPVVGGVLEDKYEEDFFSPHRATVIDGNYVKEIQYTAIRQNLISSDPERWEVNYNFEELDKCLITECGYDNVTPVVHPDYYE